MITSKEPAVSSWLCPRRMTILQLAEEMNVKNLNRGFCSKRLPWFLFSVYDSLALVTGSGTDCKNRTQIVSQLAQQLLFPFFHGGNHMAYQGVCVGGGGGGGGREWEPRPISLFTQLLSSDRWPNSLPRPLWSCGSAGDETWNVSCPNTKEAVHATRED